jgi:alkyl sulfatase BDS1-like metallo-beta-lactamase superfamily hydrolase
MNKEGSCDAFTQPKDAHPITVTLNEKFKEQLDFTDTDDFTDATYGFIETIDGAEIRNEAGDIVWTQHPYGFLEDEESPPTVNPSLWRQARLNYVHGLFKVCESIYQVRGFDLANVTFIETDSGIVVIDPLTFAESAKAALQLYQKHRGQRPVKAVIYSHSHRDHFGGVRGVLTDDDIASGRIMIIAPNGFMEEAVSEAVLAGIPMRRRALFQFGIPLPSNARGHVDSGLGKISGKGTYSLIPPTRLIRERRETMIVDGLEIQFQLTPGSEAPAEMNFFFPGLRALNTAENACHTMHNLCPVRGAKTRDTLAWSRYLDEAVDEYSGKVDVVLAQHHWPIWGTERVKQFLIEQRDLYRFLHDQTLRWMSHGLTPREIAEKLMVPDELSKKWHTRGYYGAVVHNVAAIYAHYMGPYDGNPANLHALAPSEAGTKYIEYMGGIDHVLPRAREAFERGEFRWVVQLMNHAVFADPTHREARELCADAMEQLAYQAESATWRNSYALGAQELRQGKPEKVISGSGVVSANVVAHLPVPLFMDFLAMRVRDDVEFSKTLKFDWVMTDEKTTHRMTVSNGALSHLSGSHGLAADATIRCDRSSMIALFSTRFATLSEAVLAGVLEITGDAKAVREFFSSLDTFDGVFAVVEP